MDVITLISGGTTLVSFDLTGEPPGDHTGVIEELRPQIEQVLPSTGAVLLRGLGIDTPEGFHAAVRTFGDPLHSHRGGNTPRSLVTEGVFTSTEYPPEYEIPLHNELSYATRWPERLYFFSLVPAATGGATPICDGRALLADLDPGVRDRFTTRGVTYRQRLHGGFGLGKSWQQTFETDDRAEVEAFLRDAGIDFEWTGDGELRTARHRPATREHPVTGETVWFNQADRWHPSNLPPAEAQALLALISDGEEPPQSVTYGDGEPLPAADLDHVGAAAKRHELSFPWVAGDLMIIDNMLMLHGRHPYTGQRRTLVSTT